MTQIVIETGVFDGGYFIDIPESLSTTTFNSSETSFVFSSELERSLLECLHKQISGAKKCVKLCSFIISYEPIFNILREILIKGDVVIFILTSVKEQELTSNLLSDEDADQKERNRHLEYIAELANYGAHIRASSMAHAKFLVVDRSKALIMTANLTEPSLSKNRNNLPPNAETGIVIETPTEVATLDELFDAVYLYGTEYREFEIQQSQHQYIRQIRPDILKSDLPQNISRIVWTAAKHDTYLLQELIKLISEAEHEILISTYSIISLHKLEGLKKSIQNAIDRGVVVHVFCRAMNYREQHLRACLELFEIGCQLWADNFNHAKGILIDDKKGILFTANIDGDHGLISGFEVGIALNPEAPGFYGFRAFMHYQKRTAIFQFKKQVPKILVAKFFKDHYERRDTHLPFIPPKIELVIRKSAQYYDHFIKAITANPVYYSVIKQVNSTSEQIVFEIGSRSYELQNLNSLAYEVKGLLETNRPIKEKYFLLYQEIQIRTY